MDILFIPIIFFNFALSIGGGMRHVIGAFVIFIALISGLIYQYLWFKNKNARNTFLAFFVPAIIVISGFALIEIGYIFF
jgi:hypothetical protein